MAAGDVKLVLPASANATITLASLASSATLVAGRESTAIDNTTNLYPDYGVSGFISTGTTPTAGTIEVWCYSQIDDVPTYPDVMDGTDSVETVTSADIKRASMRLVAALKTDTTSDRKYPFSLTSIRGLFGGILPARFGFFVVHDTVAALNATAGNHQVTTKGEYFNVAA